MPDMQTLIKPKVSLATDRYRRSESSSEGVTTTQNIVSPTSGHGSADRTSTISPSSTFRPFAQLLVVFLASHRARKHHQFIACLIAQNILRFIPSHRSIIEQRESWRLLWFVPLIDVHGLILAGALSTPSSTKSEAERCAGWGRVTEDDPNREEVGSECGQIHL